MNKDLSSYTTGLEETLERVIDSIISSDPAEIKSYVDKLHEQNPGISDDDLARKIVSRKSLKNGLVGAATGVGGLITLPVTVPSDLVASWRIQATMAFSIAYVYDYTPDKTDIYLIMAGDATKELLKRVGIEVGKEVTKKAMQKYITREVMKKIWKIVGRKIITKAGEKSVTSITKWVPLIGAPIGFGFDYAAARTVGHFAIKYYSGRD